MGQVYKILICTYSYPPEINGMSHVVFEHSIGLSNRGYDVSIATTYNKKRKPYVSSDRIKIYQFKTYGQGRVGGNFRGDVDGYRKFLVESKFDLIIFHGWECWSTELSIPILNRIQAKKIIVSHGTSFSYLPVTARGAIRWLSWRVHALRFSKSMKVFDHYIFLTEKSDKIRFHDKLIAEKIGSKNWSVIPNGGDPNVTKESSLDFRYEHSINETYLLLSVSEYSASKNQMMLLKAFRNSGIDDAVLVLIGSEFNAYSDRLQNYVRDDEVLRKRVRFLEKQSKEMIRAAYVAADIFLLASVTEAQPLVILDSMAAGTPFISTDVGCIHELPGGIVVKNQIELTKQLQVFINDPQILQKHRRDGIWAHNLRYNWNAILDAYDEVIMSVLRTGDVS
jgi:glycosyltransferase involved in cell wall biosynthesis